MGSEHEKVSRLDVSQIVPLRERWSGAHLLVCVCRRIGWGKAGQNCGPEKNGEM